MKQIKENTLAVSFVCPTDVVEGQPVVITDDLEVAAISGAADDGLVGNVAAHEAGAASCTVSTRFRERRDDRVADQTDAPDVGPFVYDDAGAVIGYVEASHVNLPAGLVIKKPATMEIYCSKQGPFTITGSTNDGFKMQIGGELADTITLAAGSDLTAAEIATDINGKISYGTVVALPGNRLKIVADSPYQNIAIQTVANDCYSTLGLLVADNQCSLVVETLEY